MLHGLHAVGRATFKARDLSAISRLEMVEAIDGDVAESGTTACAPMHHLYLARGDQRASRAVEGDDMRAGVGFGQQVGKVECGCLIERGQDRALPFPVPSAHRPVSSNCNGPCATRTKASWRISMRFARAAHKTNARALVAFTCEMRVYLDAVPVVG